MNFITIAEVLKKKKKNALQYDLHPKKEICILGPITGSKTMQLIVYVSIFAVSFNMSNPLIFWMGWGTSGIQLPPVTAIYIDLYIIHFDKFIVQH